jgi:hypothetical protein
MKDKLTGDYRLDAAKVYQKMNNIFKEYYTTYGEVEALALTVNVLQIIRGSLGASVLNYLKTHKSDKGVEHILEILCDFDVNEDSFVQAFLSDMDSRQ